jgi:eukaryotic-like serine/threonine-protein kinase
VARCPNCHRRLAARALCPQDGGVPPLAVAPAVPPQPEIPGFTLTTLLGVGGFGSVWEALTDTDGSRVALKVSHSADMAAILRLGREADALARVGPPHVPVLVASGALDDGRAYVAMERLVGRTLADEIAGWPAAPSPLLLQTIGEALLVSAAALHDRGIFHRDLKPENVFLVDEGVGAPRVRAKLMDFGLALPASAGTHSETLTEGGVGTPEYMAPEQISSDDGDLRSDVYALGVMLFEMATLRLPFSGDRREIEYAHMSYRPPRPSRLAPVSGALEAVILRCLAKNPAERFSDASALRTAFSEAFAPRQGPIAVGASGTTTATVAKSPSLRGNERQKVALIFVQGEGISAIDVQTAVQPFGGQLAHLAPGQCVCAFTHRAGDHPGQRALAAAEALLAKGLARRLIVDVGTVAVKARPDGPARLLSPLFSQAVRYPTPRDPEGIMIAAAARSMLPGVSCVPVPGRPDYYLLIAAPEEEDRTQTTMREAPPPLFGRDDVIRALVAEADRALIDRRPRVATVLAEQGLGKTRLAFELAHLLRARFGAVDVIELRAREPGGTDTDEVLAELLRRGLDLPLERPENGGLELLTSRLGERGKDTAAAAALLLGWISAEDPAVQSLRAAPGVLRANVARAGMEALWRLAAERPVLVVLDDAQWADHALLDAIEQATVSELPLWVCAFARPAFAESRPTWGRRAAHVHTVRLGPLDAASAAALCRHLLEPVPNVPEPVIARLVDRTQGVPLLVCDLVRGLRREGLVRKEARAVREVWYVATEVLDRLPDSPSIEWLASRELDELPAELSAHARLLALLSPEFTIEEVDGVVAAMDPELSDSFPLDARTGTDRLRRAQLLVRRRAGRHAFRTEVLREAVAKMVSEALATRIHRAALTYYRGCSLSDATRLSRLAWHASQAGERGEAAAAYLTLAESARQRHNYLDADLLYTRALDHLAERDEDRRLRAFRGRGIMRYRLGRHEGSLADLTEARQLAIRSGDAIAEADVMLDESMAHDWLYDWRRSRELAEQAHALVSGLDDAAIAPAFRARVLLALGRSFHRFNQDDEAADLLREAAQIAEAAGDEGYEVQVTASLLLGFLLPLHGMLDEAEERLERANALTGAKGDELHQAALWNNRSCLWIARNDRERFMEDNDRVLAFARRMGNTNLEKNASLNAAYFLYWRAEFDAALPRVRRAIEIDERYFRPGGFCPDGAALLARILWARGDEGEARQLVDEVRRHQDAARAAGNTELLLQANDQMLLDMSTLLVGGGGAAEWEKLMERARAVATGQELIEALEVAGLAAERRADGEGARRWWQQALVAGERIPNVMAERIRGRLGAAA